MSVVDSRNLIGLLLAAAALLQPGDALAFSPPRKWKVVDVWCGGQNASSSGREGALTVAPDKIVFESGGVVQEIPVPKITGVIHTKQVVSRSRRSTDDWNKFWDGVANQGGEGAALLAAPIYFVGLGTLQFFNHNGIVVAREIFIAWQDAAGQHKACFRAGLAPSKSLLKTITAVRGKPALDLDQQAKRLAMELKHADLQLEVVLPESVRVADRQLPNGTYSLAVLQRPNDIAELYFFRNTRSWELKNLVAQASAHVDRRDKRGSARNHEIDYDDQGGGSNLSAIRLQGMTLEIQAMALADSIATLVPKSAMVPKRGVEPAPDVPAKALDAEELLHSVRSVAIDSKTRLVNPYWVAAAFRDSSTTHGLNLSSSESKDSADAVLVVSHVPFTFDYSYVLIHQGTNRMLLEGRVTRWDGKRAAVAIAGELAARFSSRGSTDSSRNPK